MADEIIPQTKEEIEAANLVAIEAQKAQDISGQSTATSAVTDDTHAAFDNFQADVKKKADEVAAVEDPPVVEPDAAKVAADKAAADAAQSAEQKAAADKVVADEAARKTAEDAALKTAADGIFKDAPSLAPNASPKSSEAFAHVKIHAAREISRRDSELEALRKEKAELTEKLKSPIPAETAKELEDLRAFRIRLDIEADPKFKSFDQKVASANEFIYAQLRKAPAITDDIIKQIKEHGGAEKVNMEKILAAVTDPTTRRLIEMKLAEIEITADDKKKAIEAVKSDVAKYQQDREKEWAANANAHNTRTADHLKQLAAKIPWLNPVTVDPKADEPTRKNLEAHNQYAEKLRKEIEIASTDDSPEMRATLLVGMANLFRLQAAYDLVSKDAEAAKKSLAEATETIARLKNASISRLRDTNAVKSGQEVQQKKENQFTESAAEAMERMRREHAASQKAA